MTKPENERSTDAPAPLTGSMPPGPPAKSIARNTVSALLVQGTTAVFTAVMTLYLIRTLGPASFGLFTLALSLTGIAGLVARFGVPQSLARFLANSRTDPVACAGLIRDALHVTILTASCVGLALFVAAGPIASAYGEAELVWPLRGMAVALVAETILALYIGVFIALARISSNLRIVFVESLVETGATIALVAAGAGATGAAFGRATGYIVGTAMAAVMVSRLVGRLARAASHHGGRPRRKGEILRYAKSLFVLDTIYGLYSRIDVILIGAMLSTTSIGVFSAPKRLMPGLEGISLAIANSVSPRQAPSEGGRYLGAFTASLRWLMILYSAFIAVLLVWADPIVSLLFGPKYAGSAAVLQLLTPFIFLNSISPLVSTTVNYLGLARERIPIAMGALAINLVIDVVFLPRIGITAAAIGTSAAFMLYVPAHLRICRREMGFPLRPLAATGLRALLAATTMGAILGLAHAHGLTPALTVIGLLGGSAAFVAVLILTREVSVAELRTVYGAVVARVPNRRSN
ncbi:MAG: oligosaccharide flippase family protein [Thermoleophilia bacterium]